MRTYYLLTAILTLFTSIFVSSKEDLELSKGGPSKKALADNNFQVYGSLIKPQARDDSQFSSATSAICGGTSNGLIHFITSQNISNELQWYIHTPFSGSTSCQIRLATVNNPKEDDFTIIRPVDQDVFYQDGSFPCGAHGPSIETRTVRFTGQNSCDRCVLEWIWNTPEGKIRQCADITISSGQDIACFGLCQHGGVCSNGVCICPPGYSGAYCQNKAGAGGTIGILIIIACVILAIILIILAIFYCIFYRAEKKVQEEEKRTLYHGSSPSQAARSQPRPQRFEDEPDFTVSRNVRVEEQHHRNDGPDSNIAATLGREGRYD